MDIFISYSSRDRSLAQSLVDDLSALHQSAQLEDVQRLPWDQTFERIQRAQVFILTLTADSLASYARRLEYNFALRLGKPIIPVRLRPIDVTTLPESINFIVDYAPRNSLAAEELDRVLSIVEHIARKRKAQTPFFPSDELDDALNQLGDWITSETQRPEVRAFIDLNLRDFFERPDTRPQAVSLSELYAAQPGAKVDSASTARPAPMTVYGAATPRRPASRLFVVSALVVVGLAAVILLLGQRANTSDTTALLTSPSRTAPLTSVIGNATAVTAMPLTPLALLPATMTLMPSVTAPEQDAIVALASLAPSLSAALTETVAPGVTPSPLPTSPPTSTVAPTSRPTPTPAPTSTTAPTETTQPTATKLPSATATDIPLATNTNVPTETPFDIVTSTPTVTATHTATNTQTPTPATSDTPTVLPSATPTGTATATYTPTPMPTLTATPSPFMTWTPSATATNASVLQQAVYVGMQVEDTTQGVRIVSASDSATMGGARPGDLVLAVDLNDVSTAGDFHQAMDSYSVFSTVTLRLRRNGGIVFALMNLGLSDYALPTATALPQGSFSAALIIHSLIYTSVKNTAA